MIPLFLIYKGYNEQMSAIRFLYISFFQRIWYGFTVYYTWKTVKKEYGIFTKNIWVLCVK